MPAFIQKLEIACEKTRMTTRKYCSTKFSKNMYYLVPVLLFIAKVKHFEGDFDTISELSAKYSQKGYEILDFDGFGYEPHPKAYLVTGKLF